MLRCLRCSVEAQQPYRSESLKGCKKRFLTRTATCIVPSIPIVPNMSTKHSIPIFPIVKLALGCFSCLLGCQCRGPLQPSPYVILLQPGQRISFNPNALCGTKGGRHIRAYCIIPVQRVIIRSSSFCRLIMSPRHVQLPHKPYTFLRNFKFRGSSCVESCPRA